jgi:hypothetical protein
MKAYRSKTIWFSVALVIFGAVFDNFSYLQSVIDEKYYGIILVIVGIITGLLRFITSQPIKND